MAKQIISGTFTGAGNSAAAIFYGRFNVTISGTATATVEIKRSFDSGATWVTVSKDSSGTKASYASTSAFDISLVLDEPEESVMYRLTCSGYASGTVEYRVSKTM